jgi:hypothetical protein
MERTDEFIERKIIIGLITDDDYLKEVLKIGDPVQYLESSTARRLAGWCTEYYKLYEKAPEREIEGIYYQKLKEGLPTDIADEIKQDILPGLSDESIREPISKFILDQTIDYFKYRQGIIQNDKERTALENNKLDEYYKLRSEFTPIPTNVSNDETIDGEELFTLEMKSPNWLIRNLLPKGLTIFGAKSKTGKSYMMMNIAIKLAQKKPIFSDDPLKGFHAQPGHILFLALEDPKNRCLKRSREIEPEPQLDFLKEYLDVRLRWDMLTKGGLKAIEDWIVKTKSPKLIVIDVLARVWNKSSHTSGGGLYAEEYGIYSPLADLAHRYNTSIITIIHTTKAKEADVFNELLGGAGTQGPADNLMVLSRVPGQDNKRTLAIRGKDIDDRHLMLEVTQEGSQWEYLGEVDEVQLTEQRQEIFELFKSEGRPLKHKEIIQILKQSGHKVSLNSIDTLLRKMVDDGTLTKPQYGLYVLPGSESKKESEMGLGL